jgi:2-keto-4-pentenoate hydratase/2-oxohepta-3-ene-1,7-dioic acid hydratase in catechol pathway
VAAAAAKAPGFPIDRVRLGPPVNDPSKIVALGLNYRDHAREQKKEPPAVPLLFAKAPSCLIGPADPIRLPDPAVEDQVDAEAELCLVIGRRGRNIAEERALEHVLGFTIMNDVSGRRAQYGDKQWFRGKSFDTFGPCGPWVVTRDELADPGALNLEADWGDVPMQRGNTRDLIFPAPFVVSYVSRMMTLCPGDLITTGTPAGVGVFRDPPVFLRRGETVTIRLENVGVLRNPVV